MEIEIKGVVRGVFHFYVLYAPFPLFFGFPERPLKGGVNVNTNEKPTNVPPVFMSCYDCLIMLQLSLHKICEFLKIDILTICCMKVHNIIR